MVVLVNCPKVSIKLHSLKRKFCGFGGFFFVSTGLQQINLDFSKIGEFWNEKNKINFTTNGEVAVLFCCRPFTLVISE